YHEVAFNTRYADQSREALTVLGLGEMHRWLSTRYKKRYNDADKLRTALLACEYMGLYLPYREDCQRMTASFQKRFGYEGLDWDVLETASFKDAEDKLGTDRALDWLKKHGVRPPAVIGRGSEARRRV